jgi:exopolysaccharide production protein ExoY
MRKWSVDELPQLFNVLAGHMSLVGPRPVLRGELTQYEDHVGAYLELRPGLTGLWQVSGRSDVKFPERAELDAAYRARCSPWLDFTILARTPVAVLFRRGSD